METHRIVVDGSNIATEGRSTPSLAQLDDAVRQLQQEMPGYEVIVVVDATFGHRIDPAEKDAFDEAEAHGELVSPPAGTIGRGDAFLLQVALRAEALVFSNDSFQEFHGEHDWLFEPGRLIGGKPVPGVGWIFTPRTPVRGPRSRAAVAAARGGRTTRAKSAAASRPPRTRSSAARSAATTSTPPSAGNGRRPAIGDTRPAPNRAPDGMSPADETEPAAPRRRRRRTSDASRGTSTGLSGTASGLSGTASAAAVRRFAVEEPSAQSTPDAGGGTRRRSRRSASASTTPVNDPLPFLTFVTEHPLGSLVSGVVDTYVSHGAMVLVDEMRCYVPLSNLGRPAPTRAREIVARGERYDFVLVALDPGRRGAELALPELAGTILAATDQGALPPEEGASSRRPKRTPEAAGELPRIELEDPHTRIAGTRGTKTATARNKSATTKGAAGTSTAHATSARSTVPVQPATPAKKAAAAKKTPGTPRKAAVAPAKTRVSGEKRAVASEKRAVASEKRAVAGEKLGVTAQRSATTARKRGAAAGKGASAERSASAVPVQPATAAKKAAAAKKTPGTPRKAAVAPAKTRVAGEKRAVAGEKRAVAGEKLGVTAQRSAAARKRGAAAGKSASAGRSASATYHAADAPPPRSAATAKRTSAATKRTAATVKTTTVKKGPELRRPAR